MDASVLDRVREALEHRPGVRIAYVFGSAARGEATDASDLDIAVLLEDASPLEKDLLEEELERAAKREVDVTMLDRAPPLLLAEVLRDGRVLLCRDEDVRAEFELRALAMVLDTEHLRAVQRSYLRERTEDRDGAQA